jgi:hypothetical protein
MKIILLLFCILGLSLTSWSVEKSVTPPTTTPITKPTPPIEANYSLIKKKIPSLGLLEIVCEERELPPQNEILISYKMTRNKSVKSSGFILKTKTYNTCPSYKASVSNSLQLTLVSSPGERINEAGSTSTTVFQWKKVGKHFQQVSQSFYSPYKSVQAEYKKLLKDTLFAKAEKVIVKNRKKVDAAIESEITDANSICEEFQNAYTTFAEQLYQRKKYSDSFDLLLTLKRKFADPQNIFFDSKAKKENLVIVCQNVNSDNDQSEDRFYTFAKRYLNKVEYVPFLIKVAKEKLAKKAKNLTDEADSMLKFTSSLLKSAPRFFQLEHQYALILAWNRLIENNSEHTEYERLSAEDTHLIFLLAQEKKCKGVPADVLKRGIQKDDNKEALQAMTLTVGDDFYNEGLEKSAVFEYQQFVLGRALLNKCEQIPQYVFDRYFKFVKEQP